MMYLNSIVTSSITQEFVRVCGCAGIVTVKAHRLIVVKAAHISIGYQQ